MARVFVEKDGADAEDGHGYVWVVTENGEVLAIGVESGYGIGKDTRSAFSVSELVESGDFKEV